MQLCCKMSGNSPGRPERNYRDHRRAAIWEWDRVALVSFLQAWAHQAWAVWADLPPHQQLDPPVVIGTVALVARTSRVSDLIKRISSTRPTIPTPKAKVHLPCKHTQQLTQERAQPAHDYLIPVIKRKNRKSRRKTRRRLRIPTIQNQTMIMMTLTIVTTAIMTPMKTAMTRKRRPRETRERRDSWARPLNLAGRLLDKLSLLHPRLPPSSSL